MNFKYNEVRHYGCGFIDYEITGDFPVTVREFLFWIIDNDAPLFIVLKVSNECHGYWLGNSVMFSKHCDGKYYISNWRPDNLFEEIADKKIIACRASGDWEQMLYVVTVEGCENDELLG